MSQLTAFSKRHHIRMAILAVPAEAAQEVTNALVDAGIMGILNISPNILSVSEAVMINNVNLAIQLENLSYFIQAGMISHTATQRRNKRYSPRLASNRPSRRSNPSRMVRGCGGQPGMNRSTGTIALAPL